VHFVLLLLLLDSSMHFSFPCCLALLMLLLLGLGQLGTPRSCSQMVQLPFAQIAGLLLCAVLFVGAVHAAQHPSLTAWQIGTRRITTMMHRWFTWVVSRHLAAPDGYRC